MKARAFIILFCLFCCLKVNAIQIVPCEKQDSEYIALKVSSGAFIQANEIEEAFPRGSLKHSGVCEVRTEIMMDGLAFTLYKPEGNNQLFISVYNGLDGSAKLYGPFKK